MRLGVYAVWLKYSVLLEEEQDWAVEAKRGILLCSLRPRLTADADSLVNRTTTSCRTTQNGFYTSHMRETKGDMQQIIVSSLDLSACQQAGKMTVYPLLSKEKALMSQTTGEQIGSGESSASTSALQAKAVYATSLM